ncbi:MAG: hypothetical protein A3J60_02320 [Candidatus Pacebacteria bacterium RIFCSPHIGHO2_02_FULL_46_9]|nr:MAG: hypothetical protein A3J60_02320 [Candidatus Pacebacteria bacterium RIFCSPHIGHO2_02_FULL_46_9]
MLFRRWVFLCLFLLAAGMYVVGVAKVGSTTWGDSIYYYAYTRSLVMDRDIHFANESVEPSLPFPNPPTINAQTQLVSNNFSPGTGVLWIPAFVVGQTLVLTLAVFGLPVLTNGYSLFTQTVVGVSTVGFGTLGTYFFIRGLRLLFPQKIVTQTTVSFLLTTQLLYYLALDPLNSHTASFLFASVSFYLWVSIWQKRSITWRQAIMLGASLGTLALIRNQDVLTGSILIGSLLVRISQKAHAVQRVSVILLVAIAIGSIQLATNWVLFRTWQSPYLLHGQTLSWLAPDFLRVLFSPGNGLFRYAPIAGLSLVGLFAFVKTQKSLAICCTLVFFAQLYVIASWGPEIVGGPYGSRMFVGTLPFLGVGLAYLVTAIKQPWWLISTNILFFWNLYQIGAMLIRW